MFLVAFQQLQKPFPSVLSKRVNQVPGQMYSKSSQRPNAKQIKTLHEKISKRISIALSKNNQWEVKKGRSGVQKGLQLMKVNISPSITVLLDTQQFVLISASAYNSKSLKTQTIIKQELQKYQSKQKLT